MALAAVLLVAAALLGLAVGSRPIGIGTVVEALLHPDRSNPAHAVVLDQRLPRTLIGLTVGAALGMAGAVMQGITRNPIADPGLLGVNAGASLAVVAAITWFGVAGATGYVPFAFAGAALATVLVYAIAALGRDGPGPVALALVGAAVTAATTSLTTMLLLIDVDTLDLYRFWIVGSLVARDLGALAALLPFILAGALLALSAGRALDALQLGDDVAAGLGRHLGRARAAATTAVVLLCGSAVALAGPIVFIGLIVPHVARRFTGPDQRALIVLSMLLGPTLLVTADVIGRVIARPGEIEAGLVAAFLGAPVMIALVRRARPSGL